jgi:hypothetical protein
MIKYFAFSLMLFFATSAFSQTNQTEAKAAYLLAEESYGKGDYKTALDFLKQVKTIMGKSNCKILYLEIMATRELYAKDSSNAEKLLPLITEFEKSSDYADFNEEKTLEIVKLKLLLKGEQKAARDKLMGIEIAKQNRIDSMMKARSQYNIDVFNQIVNKEGKFNITLDELGNTNPKWKVKKWIADKLSSTVEFYHPDYFKFNSDEFPFSMNSSPNLLSGVFVKDGKITGYQRLIADFSMNSEYGKGSYYIYLKLIDDLNRIFINAFLVDPIITQISKSNTILSRYQWAEGKLGIMIEEIHYPKGGGGTVRIAQTVFYNSTEKATATYHPSEK